MRKEQNFKKASSATILISILIVGLFLTSCSKLPWVDFNDDTIIGASQPGAIVAIGLKRLYVMGGFMNISAKGKQKVVFPGTCVDVKSQELAKFYINGLVNKYGGQFDLLTDPEVIEEGKKQEKLLEKQKIPGIY